MNILLIFFAFPIAVIIISAILQKLLKNPIAVAALIFAIFIVITFAIFDETFLIATLIYTILAFLTALFVCKFCNSDDDDVNCLCDILTRILRNNNNNTDNIIDALQNLIQNNNDNDNDCNDNNNNVSTNCGCGCGGRWNRRYRRF